MIITIIEYGLGNPLSIKNMLKKVGVGNVRISYAKEDLKDADLLILPGVGHFEQGMKNLKENDLQETLNELVLVQKKPILGICLGMQLMTNYSEEGNCEGLAWIDAETKKFAFHEKAIKVPHMGWTDTHFLQSPFNEIRFEEDMPRFYHVHSYFVDCKQEEDVLSTASYGGKIFHNGFKKGNIMGVQFHPEKSHVFGICFFKSLIHYLEKNNEQ